MDSIKNKLSTIKNRLSKYSLEYNDYDNEDILYDGEDYEDLSEVMITQRDRLEDIYCGIYDIIEDSSEDDKDILQNVKEATNEALNYIETVASKVSCTWNLDRPEYDTEVTEALDWINDAISKLEEL